MDFKPHESLRMEAALANKEDSVGLKLYDDTWSIDLASMQQTNDQTQKKRPIRRIVIVKQAESSTEHGQRSCGLLLFAKAMVLTTASTVHGRPQRFRRPEKLFLRVVPLSPLSCV